MFKYFRTFDLLALAYIAIVNLSLLIPFTIGQQPPDKPKPPGPPPADKPAAAAVSDQVVMSTADAIPNETDGLKLPKDQTVSPDAQQLVIKADCATPVEWTVFADVKLKFTFVINGNNLILGIPATGGVVYIRATTNGDGGKPKAHAQTVVTVSAQPSPFADGTITGYHVTLIIDPHKPVGPFPTLEGKLSGLGHMLHQFDSVKDKAKIASLGFDDLIKQVGLPLAVVQTDKALPAKDGEKATNILSAGKCPATEAEIIESVKKLTTKE